MMRRRSSANALRACAVLLALSAAGASAATAATATPATAPAAAATAKPTTPKQKQEQQAAAGPFAAALASQPDLSSFAALLKFLGAADELASATDADIVLFAPTNAALDAFAQQMTRDPKATAAKDLLQEKYRPMLAHAVASHITVNDDGGTDLYQSFGGQQLIVKQGDKATVSIVGGARGGSNQTSASSSSSSSAAIVREQDLGAAGALMVVDRVLKPDNIYATPTEAFTQDPDLAMYGRIMNELAPELVKSVDDGAPGTVFVPTSAALDAYLKKAGLTEAKLLAGSPDLKVKTVGTLVYHIVPNVGLNEASLGANNKNNSNNNESESKLLTALMVGQKPLGAGDAAADKIAIADAKKTLADGAAVVKTLKVTKGKGGKYVVMGDLATKATVLSQVYAGADVVHKIDGVLEPDFSVMMKNNSNNKKKTDMMTVPMVVADDEGGVGGKPAAMTMASSSSAAAGNNNNNNNNNKAPPSSPRRMLRNISGRSAVIRNTQRANILSAVNGSMPVMAATLMNNYVGALAPIGRIPVFYLTQTSQPAMAYQGGFLV